MTSMLDFPLVPESPNKTRTDGVSLRSRIRRLTFGSFCSGIGAPETAWVRLGWLPRFTSEIEPFPCAVLEARHPGVRNFGDMTKLDTAELPDADVWVAGTPCQAFSVAGLRKSLSDDRGNLTLHFCRMVHERDPAIVVWENVPGVLNTPDNAFGCFLAGLVGEGQPLVSGIGSWADAGMAIGPRRTAAWRVLDAQYFGLAQRRRRVFVVSFRTGDGLNPGAVLFEPGSLPRDSAPSREAGAGASIGVAKSLRGRSNTSHREDADTYISVTLTKCGAQSLDPEMEPLLPVAFAQNQRDEIRDLNDCAGSLAAEPGMKQQTYVALQGSLINRDKGGPCGPGHSTDGSMFTLTKQDRHAVAFTDCRGDTRGSGIQVTGDISNTIHAAKGMSEQQAVAFDWMAGESGNDDSFKGKGRKWITRAGDYTGALGATKRDGVQQGMAVRRLTPRECERLQGFPDDYTAVTFRGKPAADGPRYRALGNSMAVPVLAWIGERIEKVLFAAPSHPKGGTHA